MTDKKSVLIIEDEADCIDFIKAILSETGDFNIDSVSDGSKALEKVTQVNPDLIMLDVQLPGKNGFEIFQDLQKNDSTKNIPVIVLTGVEGKMGIGFSGKDMKNYLGKEPNAYIPKPIDPSSLQEAIKKLL